MKRLGDERGAAMVLALALLVMALTLACALYELSFAVRKKIRLQTAADMAVLSALNHEAEALNTLALGNRSVIAHAAFAAQLTALVSESSFYRRILEGFSWLVRFIPYGGPLLGKTLSQGGQAVEKACREAARGGIPAAVSFDRVIAAEETVIRAALPPLALAAAEGSLRTNEPDASLALISRAAILRQATGVTQGMRPLPPGDLEGIIARSLDRHTARRDWQIGKGAVSLPVRKTGRTLVEDGDFSSFDCLEVKVPKWGRWRWKSVLATRSRASDYGYRGHGQVLDFTGEGIPAGITVMVAEEVGAPSVHPGHPPVTMRAVSAGRLHYLRTSEPEEEGNLLNPFWRARLIPISEEETAARLIPSPLRGEIRH